MPLVLVVCGNFQWLLLSVTFHLHVLIVLSVVTSHTIMIWSYMYVVDVACLVGGQGVYQNGECGMGYHWRLLVTITPLL